MDKKILAIFSLLIIMISATVLFVTLDQTESEGYSQDSYPAEDVSDEDLSNEIDDEFLSEDDELDIGDMV